MASSSQAQAKAQAQAAHSTRSLPETGVRKRSYKAERIHRQDETSDDPKPVCSFAGDDAGFKHVDIETMLAFDRWSLCGACFPDDDADDCETDRSHSTYWKTRRAGEATEESPGPDGDTRGDRDGD